MESVVLAVDDMMLDGDIFGPVAEAEAEAEVAEMGAETGFASPEEAIRTGRMMRKESGRGFQHGTGST